jgi:hypothetical protein
MLVSITIKCDWPGCTAAVTLDAMPQSVTKAGWKMEHDDYRAYHLCPAHGEKSWQELYQEQEAEGPVPLTGTD